MGEYHLGQFIYRSRKAVGMTPEELCRDKDGMWYMLPKTLLRIEQGKQRPGFRVLREIMKCLGKENCFYLPCLKTTDYRVLEISDHLRRALFRKDFAAAEGLLAELEKGLTLQYVSNRQYLVRVHVLIDRSCGRIRTQEALELLEEALRLTVHSYGTECFSYEILLPGEILLVCDIADCCAALGNIPGARRLLQTVSDMLNDETARAFYPAGLREIVRQRRSALCGELSGTGAAAGKL